MLDFSTKYLNILTTKLSGLNLTNILDPIEFYNKQILDSIFPYQQSIFFQQEVQKKKIIIDVGFGGGFPILPLASLLPEVTFIGIEAKRKKVEAVKFISEELGLMNVKLIHSRLEHVVFDTPSVITFKAVGAAKDYLSLINQTINDLSVFFYKGPSFLELEGSDLKSLNKTWKLVENQEINVPGTQKRFLVSFIAQNVPRGTSKSLVKISDFI
jgi:16S rRNA (guanine527-N7)-methyltransferase